VSFADDCRRANSTRLASRRGYIALYPRAWRVAGAADLVARRGALSCCWTIAAERGRRITLFSARVGARLHRAAAGDNSSVTGPAAATDGAPWCPASVELVELDGSAAVFNVCLRHVDASRRQPHDLTTATRTVYESKGSQLEVRLSFDKDQASTANTKQWRLGDILHVLYYIGELSPKYSSSLFTEYHTVGIKHIKHTCTGIITEKETYRDHNLKVVR